MPRVFPPPPIDRIGVRPDHDDPNAVTVRPRGSRQPHSDATFEKVRRLVEQSTLSYRQIADRTRVSLGCISYWTRDHGWKRPPFAPRANDLMPTPRASAQLKRRTLAKRLDTLAERHIRELEESQCVDPEKLGEAQELLRMAKLAARRRPRRRIGDLAEPEEFRRPIAQLCAAGVDLSRAPRAAVLGFPGKPRTAAEGYAAAARPRHASPMAAVVDEGGGEEVVCR